MNEGSTFRGIPNQAPFSQPQISDMHDSSRNRFSGSLAPSFPLQTVYLQTSAVAMNSTPYPASPISIPKKIGKKIRKKRFTSFSRYPGVTPIKSNSGSMISSHFGFRMQVGT